MKSPTSIDKLLNSGNHGLASLITRTRQLGRFTKGLHELIGPELSPHCTIADIHQQELVLGVDKAAWATKLRFAAPALLKQLQQRFPELSTVERITIQMLQPLEDPRATSASNTPPHLSAKNAQLLKSLAQTVDNTELRAALERLARHADEES